MWLAFARHEEFHLLTATPGTQPLTNDFGFFDFFRQHHLLRNVGRFGVELLDKLLHDFSIAGFFGAFQDEVFPPDEFAAADEEDLHAGFPVRARHGDHIRVQVIGVEHDFLPLDDGLDGLELVTDSGCFFEAQFCRCFLHLVFQALHDWIGLSVQEILQIGDHLTVFGLGHGSDAGSGTQLDVEVETGAGVGAGDFTVAGQVGEDAAQHIQGLVYSPDGSIRPEVARTVIRHLARHGDFGVGIRPMDFDVGVAFVVLQSDVEARTVALDQVHLQDERFEFRADHDPFDIGDLAYQTAGLVVVARIAVEIRTHARAQVDCLADVDDLAVGVFHQVAAGFGGQGVKNALQMLGDFHAGNFNIWLIVHFGT